MGDCKDVKVCQGFEGRVCELCKLFADIFLADYSDLDFGIYKLFNMRRKRFEKFIAKLDEKINEAVDSALGERERELEIKLKGLEQEIKEVEEKLGKTVLVDGEIVDEFRDTPLGQEYSNINREREELNNLKNELRNSVVNYLYEFFKRYYQAGDFLPRIRHRRVKPYAIPYEGEEVLLHWATKDQYYIKTSDTYLNYTFKVSTGAGEQKVEYKVIFKVVSAETSLDNTKEKQRRFVLASEKPIEYSEGEKRLVVRFEHRVLSEEEKGEYLQALGDNSGDNSSLDQAKLNQHLYRRIIEKAESEDKTLAALLQKSEKVSDGEIPLLLKHLNRFTKRNTADFFIHKNLRRFLLGELDRYIKNEVLALERLDRENIERTLPRARAVKKVAEEVIEYLSEIEEAQKRLWEKKKFVLSANYVITLDRVKKWAGEEFYREFVKEILKNEDQKKEWEDLLGVQVSSEADLKDTLPVDTKHFDEEFKWRLLEAISQKVSIDEALDGLLVKSENWQALNTLKEKYRERVQTIYIDPPFKTGQDFLYPDRYEDATWLSLMIDRISIGKDFLRDTGAFFLHLDKNAVHLGRLLGERIFGAQNFVNEIIWCYEKPRKAEKKFKENHDNILLFRVSDEMLFFPQYVAKANGNDEKLLGDWWYIPSFSTAMTAKERVYFDTQKREELMKIIIESTSRPGNIVMDHFAGSGTTLLVAQKLGRKWIGVEVASCFHESFLDYLRVEGKDEGSLNLEKWVQEGRLYKVEKIIEKKAKEIRALVWKWGILGRLKMALAGYGKREPTKFSQDVNWQGGGFFKYIDLEQYEDALENAVDWEELEGQAPPKGYLTYKLLFRKGSVKAGLEPILFEDPFGLKLRTEKGPRRVDLVETFNYLAGVEVERVKTLRDEGRTYRIVLGKRGRKSVLIIWRKMEGWDEKELKREREFLSEALRDELNQVSEVYINGISLLKGALPLEEFFHRPSYWEVEHA